MIEAHNKIVLLFLTALYSTPSLTYQLVSDPTVEGASSLIKQCCQFLSTLSHNIRLFGLLSSLTYIKLAMSTQTTEVATKLMTT